MEREIMSIFGSIMGAIFGHGAQAKTAESTTAAAPGAAVVVVSAAVPAVLAWAPWPKIAPMMLPKMLMISHSVRPRQRLPHGGFQ